MVIEEQCFGGHGGVQSTAILAEFALLYARTGDEQYLRTAKLIVEQWDRPSGLRLLSDALANKPPAEMKSLKAYEVLANYEGLFELYRVTGDRRYLEGLSNFLTNLREQELMVHGSMSNNEYWFRGTKNQTAVLEQSTETCVTAQWMLLCNEMLQLTGEPKWADMLETSLYNALLGAMTPEGHWWAYFAYLNGERVPCQLHHPGLGMVCCVASGPRGLLLTPQWAVMKSRHGIAVNLYAEGTPG